MVNRNLRVTRLGYAVFPHPCQPQRELAHDDCRRAQDHLRWPHDDDRRPHDDFIMTFVSRVSAPATICNNAAGGSEEGDGASE